MLKISLVFTSLFILSACANNSGSFRIGENEYQVTTRATWELGGRAGAKKMALEEATKQCVSLNK